MSQSPHNNREHESSPQRGPSNGERDHHSSRGRSRSHSPRHSRSASQHSQRSQRSARDRSPRDNNRDKDRNSPDNKRGGDRDPEQGTQVYVAKLHRRTREEDLREAFAAFGKIKNCVLKHTYAFIDFEDVEAAGKAIKEMNGKSFVNGEELIVEQSVPGGKKRRMGPQRDDVCFKCQRRGHWASDCKSRRRSRSGGSRDRRRRHHSRSGSHHRRKYVSRRSRSRSPYGGGGRRNDRRDDSRSRDFMREGKCFGCGKKGHIKRDCPGMGGSRSRSRSGHRERGGDRYRDNRERGGGFKRREQRRSPSSSRSYQKRRGGSSRGSSKGSN